MVNCRQFGILLAVSVWLFSCDKEYTCNCFQDVAGIDTTFTVAGEGYSGQKVCDAFDSETTEFGITKTIDCEPY